MRKKKYQYQTNFRGIIRTIPEINYEEEVECPECKHIFDIDIQVDPDEIYEAIDDFIDDSDEDEILKWAGSELKFNNDIADYVEQGFDLMKLGTLSKDEFLENLANIAKIGIHLLNIKELR